MNENASKEDLPLVDIWIKKGRESYLHEKRASIEAASYVYLIWRASCSPDAEQEDRRLIAEAIEKTNQQIRKDNGALSKARDRGSRFIKMSKTEDEDFDSLSEDDPDKAKARKLAALPLREFKKMLFVEIKFDAKEPHETRLAVVKHALLLRTNRERSKASRYAKVVQWLAEKFSEVSPPKLVLENLVSAIEDEGGFEEVIALQRAKNPKTHRGKGSKPRSSDTPDTTSDPGAEEAERCDLAPRSQTVTLMLADGVKTMPTGHVLLDCVVEDGFLKVLSIQQRPEVTASGEGTITAPPMQPATFEDREKNSEPVPAA